MFGTGALVPYGTLILCVFTLKDDAWDISNLKLACFWAWVHHSQKVYTVQDAADQAISLWQKGRHTVALAKLQVDSHMAASPRTFPKVGVYFPIEQMLKFSMGEGLLFILWVRWLLHPYTLGFQDWALVIPQEFTSDGWVQQRSLPQFLDTFCAKLKVGGKQWLSLGLEATVQMEDNIFLGTLEFPGCPTSGPAMSTAATSVVMPATPLLESVAKGRGKDLDKLTGKWSSSDNSQVPLKKPWETVWLQGWALLTPLASP